MSLKSTTLSGKQIVFRELVLGTLVYAVVLGFFNDYTSTLYTSSYTITFLVAVVLQILTYPTLLLKAQVAGNFKQKSGPWSKIGLVIGVWLVLFLSKFVFLAVIDFVFGSSVQISGFVGLMAIILVMTIAKESIDFASKKLAD